MTFMTRVTHRIYDFFHPPVRNIRGYYTFDWEFGLEIVEKLGGLDHLKLFLDVSGVAYSKHIHMGDKDSFSLVVFRIDDGDRLVLKFNSNTNHVDITLEKYKRVGFLFRKVHEYTYTAETSLSMYPSIRCPIGDRDLPNLVRGIETVTGKCLDPFGVL